MPSVLPARCAVPFFQFLPKLDSYLPSQQLRFLGINQHMVLRLHLNIFPHSLPTLSLLKFV